MNIFLAIGLVVVNLHSNMSLLILFWIFPHRALQTYLHSNMSLLIWEGSTVWY